MKSLSLLLNLFATLFAFIFINVCHTENRLVCHTKNETCQVQTGSLKEIIAVINFTFAYEAAENVTHIRFEDSEIGEVPKLLIDKFPNVVVLDLKFCRLKRFRKPLLENSTDLIELDLSYNKLKRLEESSFLGAENLLILNIFRNEIIDVHERAFKGLTNLDRLVLASNEIRRLKSGVLKPLTHLTELDLRKNRLETVGNQLQGLLNLEILDLSYNKIRKVDIETLKNLENLHIADFSFNRLDDIHSDALLAKPNLFAVNFADNRLTNLNLNILENLSIIDLSRNKLENLTLVTNGENKRRISITAPFNQLQNFTCQAPINKLNLTFNNLTNLNLLNGNVSVLTLDISNNPLNLKKSELKKLPNDLTELIARNISRQGSNNIEVLLKELPTLAPDLSELDLSENELFSLDWDEFPPYEKIKRLVLINTDVENVDSFQKVFPNLSFIRLSSENSGFSCTDVNKVFQPSDIICKSE